jgi:UDP-glucose 4-epimerase
MKILVTGTGGYIGSLAARRLLDAGLEVVGVDSCLRGFKQPMELLQQEFGKEKFRYYEVDIRHEIDSVFEKEDGIDAVMHFAALCNVGESEKFPHRYFENNVGGVIALVEAMHRAGVDQLVFSSTCATYGNPESEVISETHAQNAPTSPYGESKAMAERVIAWYVRLYGMRCVTMRYFNVCGASDDSLFGDSKKPSFHLMQNAVRATLGLAPFVLNYTQVDTPDGSPIRDYINVEDLVNAHLKAMEYLKVGGESDVFNLGTGAGNSVYEIVSEVERIMGVPLEKSAGERRGGDANIAVADNRKAKAILGWEPQRDLEQSIRSLAAWYKKRPEGWDY